MNFDDLDLDGNPNNEGGNQGGDDDTNKQNQNNNDGSDKNNEPNPNPDDNNNDDGNDGSEGNDGDDGNHHDDSSTGEFKTGDIIEVDGVEYTIDDKGNAVDKDGNIFKEAKDIKSWTDSLNDDSSDDELTISNIQKTLGIEITDENGKPVEFEESPEGVKSYIDSVIDLKSREIQEATINKFYSDNPLVKDFINYVQLKGTPVGFGEIPDRSGITVNKDDVAQQEAIIKMAAKEFGNSTINDNYINYLKSNNALYDEARKQLAALVEKDKQYRANLEAEAEAERQAAAEENAKYWDSVKSVIDSRKIDNYKLPDTITKTVDGVKQILTINDFMGYISNPTETDDKGNKCTGYQRDIRKLTQEQLINRDILDAWLLFTNGTYKDLVDMAIKEEQVKRIKLTTKSKPHKTVKITRKPSNSNNVIDDVVLDY